MKIIQVLLVAVATACSAEEIGDARGNQGLGTDGPHAIRTEDSSYRLSYDGRITLSTDIPFSFRNPLPDAIYVVNCRRGLDLSLERLEDGTWQHYWSPILLLCLSPPIVIPPGTTYQDTARILGILPGHNAGPEFGSDEPEGTYRLRWGNLVLHYRDYEPGRGFGDPLPEELTISNAFRLEDPRDGR